MFTWYVRALRKYAVFRGSAGRREFWSYTAVTIAIAFGLGMLAGASRAAGCGPAVRDFIALTMLGYFAATFVPSIAVTARRLHDSGASRWLLLLALLPYAGAFAICFLCARPSRPRGPSAAAPEFAAADGALPCCLAAVERRT